MGLSPTVGRLYLSRARKGETLPPTLCQPVGVELKSTGLEQAIATIRQLGQSCGNLNGRVQGPDDTGWYAYLNWAEECERQLRNIFADPAIVHGAYSERYWKIAQKAAPSRTAVLIMTEVRAQQDRLNELAATLLKFQALGKRDGHLLVLDTNVLLHFQRIDKIPWRDVMGVEKIRLVLPLMVLDELDRKRSAGGSIARRARSATKPLDDLEKEISELGYGTLSAPNHGTTVEYLLDPRGHRRQPDPDGEILDRATFLHRITGRRVYVATNDIGMRVRLTARQDGLEAVRMPEKFRRDQEELSPA